MKLVTSHVPVTGGRSRFAKLVYGCSLLIPAMLVIPSHVQAAPINLGTQGGVYNISNINGQLVGVSNACINWSSSAPCVASPGVGDQGSGDPLDFSIANGSIKDLIAGEVFPVVDFELAPGTGGNVGATMVHFDLLNLVPSSTTGTNDCTSGATGSNCAPAGSPFFLHQSSANSVSISLQVNLEAYTGGSGTNYSLATLYTGLFTTQITGTINNVVNGTPDTIPNILAFLNANSSNAITATWSAAESPVTGTPEPMSFLLMGSGLLGAAVLGKRFRRS